MKHDNEKNVTKVIGIDLAKNIFHVHGVNQAGNKVMSKKMSRQQLKTFMMNLSPCLVGMVTRIRRMMQDIAAGAFLRSRTRPRRAYTTREPQNPPELCPDPPNSTPHTLPKQAVPGAQPFQ